MTALRSSRSDCRHYIAVLSLIFMLLVSDQGTAAAAEPQVDFTLVPQNARPDGNGLINDIPIEVRGGQVNASSSGAREWLGQMGSSTANITGTYDPATGILKASYKGTHSNKREAGPVVQDVTFTFTGSTEQQINLDSGTVQVNFAGELQNEVKGGPSEPPTTTQYYTMTVLYSVEISETASEVDTDNNEASGSDSPQERPAAETQKAPEPARGFPIGTILIGITVAAAAALGIGLLIKNLLVSPKSSPAKSSPAKTEDEEEPETDGDEEEKEDKESYQVSLELTYPAGRSPKVFTTGWVFGARCIVTTDSGDERNISSEVEWGGSGSFSPSIGSRSRPTFAAEGDNTITLTVQYQGTVETRDFNVTATSPDGYAHVGSKSDCPADSHGCGACPHHVWGFVESGSAMVLVGGKRAARVGDGGKHYVPHDYDPEYVERVEEQTRSGQVGVCCGPNTFTIAEGDSQVLIDGRPAARIGDRTDHCGGTGRIES